MMLKARNVLRTLGEAARRETLSQRVGWRVGDDAAVNCRGNVPPPPTSILMHTVSTHFWQSTPLSGSVLNRARVGCNNMWCAVVGTPIAFVVFGGQNAHFNSSRYVFVFTFASNYCQRVALKMFAWDIPMPLPSFTISHEMYIQN